MAWKEKMNDFIKQVGPVRLGLLLICGIFLIYVSFPAREKKTPGETQQTEVTVYQGGEDQYVEKMEQKLEEILTAIEGVGRTEVMITLSSSSEEVLHQDETREENSEKENGESSKESKTGTTKKETVIVDQDGDEIPYVVKTNSPVVEGVVVVIEGGNKTYVVSAVTEAVQALFHLEGHKIKVLKMEEGL